MDPTTRRSRRTSLPSTSVTCAPNPRWMNAGWPPTARHERTGTVHAARDDLAPPRRTACRTSGRIRATRAPVLAHGPKSRATRSCGIEHACPSHSALARAAAIERRGEGCRTRRDRALAGWLASTPRRATSSSAIELPTAASDRAHAAELRLEAPNRTRVAVGVNDHYAEALRLAIGSSRRTAAGPPRRCRRDSRASCFPISRVAANVARSRSRATRPELHLRRLRGRRVEPVRARRQQGGRDPARRSLQPALHLRRRRAREDPPRQRHRPSGARARPDARVGYLSCDAFMNDLISRAPPRPDGGLQAAAPPASTC